jgi:hypothetical protein
MNAPGGSSLLPRLCHAQECLLACPCYRTAVLARAERWGEAGNSAIWDDFTPWHAPPPSTDTHTRTSAVTYSYQRDGCVGAGRREGTRYMKAPRWVQPAPAPVSRLSMLAGVAVLSCGGEGGVMGRGIPMSGAVARFHSRPLSSHALMLARLRTDVLCHAHAGAFAGCHGGRIRVTAASSKKFTFSRRNTRPHAVGRAFRDGDMQHALHVQEVRLLPGMCYDFMWFHSMSKRPPQPRSGVGHGWVQ